jgi:hypothetical protein
MLVHQSIAEWVFAQQLLGTKKGALLQQLIERVAEVSL